MKKWKKRIFGHNSGLDEDILHILSVVSGDTLLGYVSSIFWFPYDHKGSHHQKIVNFWTRSQKGEDGFDRIPTSLTDFWPEIGWPNWRVPNWGVPNWLRGGEGEVLPVGTKSQNLLFFSGDGFPNMAILG